MGLLTEMDGFTAQDKPVIVLAATNQPEVLDAALLRPGRFDRQVLVDRPDLSGRKTILEIYAKKVKLADGVDLDSVAQATSGFAGADLANLVNEAALLAARAQRTSVLWPVLRRRAASYRTTKRRWSHITRWATRS